MPENVHSVMSGTPYSIRFVNGRPPASLDDFVTADIIELTVNSGHDEVCLKGSAHRQGDVALVYEKDHEGTGKDVRVWEIAISDGVFSAVPASAF
jgi:hypothetical protein